jgi:hypothetical protein
LILTRSRFCLIRKVGFFIVEFSNMANEIDEIKGNTTKEKLEGFAQTVIGEIESLGGVITGDPQTSAEGDFNVQVGNLHRESAEALEETEHATENKTPEELPNNQTTDGE